MTQQAKIETKASPRTHRIINIMGLPGSGKTTLAKKLSKLLGAVHINADWARSTITKHLGFTPEDRLEQARILGSLAGYTSLTAPFVVVDFVNPTLETRRTFHAAANAENSNLVIHKIWMDTIDEGRFADTNMLFEKPLTSNTLTGPGVADLVIQGWQSAEQLDDWATVCDKLLRSRAGYKRFYIRYNTLSDGNTKHWRIIQADNMAETLVDGFHLNGDMYPASTIEHNVKKWNVGVEGFPQFTTNEDGTVIFSLS